MAHFLDHDHGGVLVQHLIDGHHLAHLHQALDDFSGLDRHLVGKLTHGNRLRHMHVAHHRFSRRGKRRRFVLLRMAVTALFWSTAPTRCAPGIAAGFDGALLGRVISLPRYRSQYCGGLGRLFRSLLVGVARFGGRFVQCAFLDLLGSTLGECGLGLSGCGVCTFALLARGQICNLAFAQGVVTARLFFANAALVFVDHRQRT